MRLRPREPLEPIQQGLIDSPRTKLSYQLIIIDRKLFPVCGDGSLNVPGRDDLVVCLGCGWVDR